MIYFCLLSICSCVFIITLIIFYTFNVTICLLSNATLMGQLNEIKFDVFDFLIILHFDKRLSIRIFLGLWYLYILLLKG